MKKIFIIIFIISLPFFLSCKKTFERKDTLTVLLSKSINNISPYFAKAFEELAISNLIAQGLFSYDIKQKRIRNEIAEKYEVSNNGLRWIFTIKKDLALSNGEKINSKLIEDNFKEFLKKSPKNIYYQNIRSISGSKEYEIIIDLHKPDFEFIFLLSGRNRIGFISLTEENKIIGYGPYTLKLIDDKKIILKRNKNYKDSIVETDQIIFKTIESERERLELIFNRQVDVITINDISNINEINNRPFLRTIKKLNSSKILAVAGNSPFDNQNAVNAILGFSFIRNKIAFSLYNDYADTEINILPSYSQYYRNLDHFFFYNPDEVQKELKKSNIENITFTLNIPDNLGIFNLGIDLWKNELQKIGIKMEIRKEIQNIIIEKINNNNFQAAIVVINEFMIHPRDIMIYHETFSSEKAKKGLIPVETLKYIDQALSHNNISKRNLMYFRAFENFSGRSRILGIINLPSYYLTTDNVQNLDDLLTGKFDRVRVYK